jgi:hypothetical protein
MKTLLNLHDFVKTTLEQRPKLSYLFAAAGGGGSMISLIEAATKFIGLAGAIISLAVAVYAFRIQRRQWAKIKEE